MLFAPGKQEHNSFWLRVSRTCPDGMMRLTCAVWFQELVWMPRTTCGWPRCTGLSPPGVRWVIILLYLAPPVSRKGKMLSAELGILIVSKRLSCQTSNARGLPPWTAVYLSTSCMPGMVLGAAWGCPRWTASSLTSVSSQSGWDANR